MLVNLLPYRIIQPWVDAAFEEACGIDLQEVWLQPGSARAFRFPDPERPGQRQANGALPARRPRSWRALLSIHAASLIAGNASRCARLRRPPTDSRRRQTRTLLLASERRTVRRQPVRRQPTKGRARRRPGLLPEPARGDTSPVSSSAAFSGRVPAVVRPRHFRLPAVRAGPQLARVPLLRSAVGTHIAPGSLQGDGTSPRLHGRTAPTTANQIPARPRAGIAILAPATRHSSPGSTGMRGTFDVDHLQHSATFDCR